MTNLFCWICQIWHNICSFFLFTWFQIPSSDKCLLQRSCGRNASLWHNQASIIWSYCKVVRGIARSCWQKYCHHPSRQQVWPGNPPSCSHWGCKRICWEREPLLYGDICSRNHQRWKCIPHSSHRDISNHQQEESCCQWRRGIWRQFITSQGNQHCCPWKGARICRKKVQLLHIFIELLSFRQIIASVHSFGEACFWALFPFYKPSLTVIRHGGKFTSYDGWWWENWRIG